MGGEDYSGIGGYIHGIGSVTGEFLGQGDDVARRTLPLE